MTTRQDPYVNFLIDIERVAKKYGYNIDISCNYCDGDEKYPRVEITFVNHAIGADALNIVCHTCYTLSRNSNRCDVCGARLPRLIDADAFNEKYGDYYAEEGTTEGFIGTVGQLIDNAPTVEERPKGYWVKDSSQSNEFVDWFKCSNCGSFKDNKSTTSFCPNCGARMYES